MNSIWARRKNWGRGLVLLMYLSSLSLGVAASALTGVLQTAAAVTWSLVAVSAAAVALTAWYSRRCPKYGRRPADAAHEGAECVGSCDQL